MQKAAEKEILAVVEGCSPSARRALAALLTTAFSTLNNLDIICPVVRPPCHEYLRFQELRRLHSALNERLNNEQQKS